ncbi:MAG: phosphate/phosphite/phosphonate ABC transporter substrate-binding protein [Prochlorothrix sp.]
MLEAKSKILPPWAKVKHWVSDRVKPHNPDRPQNCHPDRASDGPPDRPQTGNSPTPPHPPNSHRPRSHRPQSHRIDQPAPLPTFPLRRRFHPSPLVLILALTLGACTGSPAPNSPAATDPLTFGILSTEAEENQRPLWEPFLEAMATSLGQPVEGFYAQQYSDLIEGLKSGTVEVAWMGGKAYIDAAQEAGAEAFALTVAADGSQGYTAHLIARRDQPWLQTAIDQGGDRYVLQNAPNLTFAFNDPKSTSGFLVPNYYIFSRNGVQASDIFSAVRFEGDHEATALAVAEGRVDVATNNSEALARFAQTHPAAYSNRPFD